MPRANKGSREPLFLPLVFGLECQLDTIRRKLNEIAGKLKTRVELKKELASKGTPPFSFELSGEIRFRTKMRLNSNWLQFIRLAARSTVTTWDLVN